MTPEQIFWAGIAGSVLTIVVAPILARILSRKDSNVANQLTLATANSMTVETMLKALKHESEQRLALEKRVDDLEEKLDAKNEYIEVLEREIAVLNDVRKFLKNLLSDLKARGIEFTPPSDGLLDTNPKIKVWGKKL